MSADLDHLVIVADTLAQGAAWCKATLGVVPGPGGKHPLMGTHNRLLRIDSKAFPKAYLEIIAIDPEAPAPGRSRWFSMDDAAQLAAVRQAPRLVHVVARTSHIERLQAVLLSQGLDPGRLLAAERDTPQGLLAWRILVRDDGRLECAGALPTLIEWTGRHPSQAMPASPLQLAALSVSGMPLQVQSALGLRGVTAVATANADEAARWQATLHTPLGVVMLSSWPN